MYQEKYSKEQIAIFIVINIVLLALITYASTSLTVSFFGSIGAGEVKTSNLIMGLVNDCCKIFLPLIVGIALFKKKYFHAAVLVFIIAGCMYISYLASQGLDLNISNQQLLSGSNKQEIVSAKAQKVTEVSRLETERNELTAPIKAQIGALPKDRITQKGKLQDKINKIVQDYSLKIKAVQDKIDEYDGKIQNYKVDTSITVEGYHALAKFTGLTVGDITKWKNIFMEILAIILSVNLGLLIGESNLNMFDLLGKGLKKLKDGSKGKSVTAVCEDKIELPELEEEAEKKQKADPPLPTPRIDNATIEKYKRYMLDTCSIVNGQKISKGYKPISEAIGIDTETGRAVKGILQEQGYIQTQGNRTIITRA